MGWAAKSISVLLASSFLLAETGYGEEQGLDRHPALTQRLRIVPEYKLLELPSRHTILWNKPGHSVSSLYTLGIGYNLTLKGWRCANYSPYGGELYKSSSFDEYLLTRGNTEKKRGWAMGIGEQIAEAYFGGVVGGLLGILATAAVIGFLKADIQPGLEAAGWVVIIIEVAGTIGVPLGSATWLHIQGDRSFWRILSGAVTPMVLVVATDSIFSEASTLLAPSPRALMVGWTLAPIGTVIGYNLAD